MQKLKDFYKECLTSIITNSQNKNYDFNLLKDIKVELEKEIVNLNTLQDKLKKLCNLISPNNINTLFTLFIDKSWSKNFTKEENELLQFLITHVNAISIWDSTFNYNDSTDEKSIIYELLYGIQNIDKILNKPLKPKKNELIFTLLDCEKVLCDLNIKITKTINPIELIEERNGCYIYIRVKNKILVIRGIFKDDILNMSFDNKIIKTKYEQIKDEIMKWEDFKIPKEFKMNYLNTINLRDLIVENTLIYDIKYKYNDYKTLISKPLLILINDFLMASKYRKLEILTILLISDIDTHNLAVVLFDILKSKNNTFYEIYNSLHYILREILEESKLNMEKEELQITDSDLSYEKKIALMRVDNNIKIKAMDKLKLIKTNFQGDAKAQLWLDGLLKIPFNIYSTNEIINFKKEFIKNIEGNHDIFSDNDIEQYMKNKQDNSEWEKYKIDRKLYLKNVREILDKSVYGHKNAKKQLERIFAQWINGESNGVILGLQGPPGTGKTSLIKNGLSKCLVDKNGKPRPFSFLPIGGSVNGSTLVGHSYTYHGATWGRIVDILITSECMNPIIFIDELDKVSSTEQGQEIISILTHLTDSTQNDEFEDKFFSGIKLDLSKALIVFSFNDPDLIDHILKDRITIIETNPLLLKEKITIVKDYMYPEICKTIGFNTNEIVLDDDIIEYIINNYTNEAGVRKLKEKIIEIIRDINLNRFNDKYSIPFIITKEYITKLFENYPKIKHKKIHNEPKVGLVNGLYATSSGLGGITPIQATKFPSDKMLDLNLTGKAGDIMQESVQYALKVAFSLLSKKDQEKIIDKPFGIHIHCPDGATPKDGPSAGLAFTLAIYSLLVNKKVNNKVCMTGEVDLFGNAGIIGGLSSKLIGAKNAGCTLVLIPEDNLEDLEKLRREDNIENDNFKILTIKNINEIIKYSLL